MRERANVAFDKRSIYRRGARIVCNEFGDVPVALLSTLMAAPWFRSHGGGSLSRAHGGSSCRYGGREDTYGGSIWR